MDGYNGFGEEGLDLLVIDDEVGAWVGRMVVRGGMFICVGISQRARKTRLWFDSSRDNHYSVFRLSSSLDLLSAVKIFSHNQQPSSLQKRFTLSFLS